MNFLDYLSRNYPLHILLGVILFALILSVAVWAVRQMMNGYYLDHQKDETIIEWLERWLDR